ncbi:MAG TPA: aldo/keto reductase [Gemmatimonadales bacterium]|nr:aldo/keto reductase [Gemmatimonadales bacterium]
MTLPDAHRVGLGLAALGRPAYITLEHAHDLEGNYEPGAMEQRAHAVLDAAYAAGVRYFDVARSYGRAEDFLASWLANRRIAPGAVVVASKWGYTYTAGWRVDAERHEVKDHSLATLRRQLAETRTRLGAYLSLYQIHSATLESGVLDDGAVIDELARLKATGLRIGLTLTGASQSDVLRRALEVKRDGARVFDAVQATWNLLERGAGSALEEAHEAGLRVILKETLANGRLTERNASPALAVRLATLRAEAARLDTTVDALALAAALAQPWADIVLSGAATTEQLRSNLRGLEVPWTAQTDARLRSLTMESGEYWRDRNALAWN